MDKCTRGGVILDDGSVRWIIDDIRDGLMVGSIRLDYVLRAGRVKGNGALLQRASYPRLFKWIQDNASVQITEALWPSNKHLFTLGDGSTTFRVPDLGGKWLQMADSVGQLAAGLPNIDGEFRAAAFQGNSGATYSAGAFIEKSNGNSQMYERGGGSANSLPTYALNASKSSAIYGNANTVQPPSLQLIVQIKY